MAGTLVRLLGLVAVTVLADGLLWPVMLGRRMEGTQPARRGPGQQTRRLPGSGTSAAGAVAATELRLWLRDPVRLSCLVIALIVGAGTGVPPRVTAGTTLLLPFAGTIIVVIAAACACNLYGNDGSSVWLTVMAPGSARADIRGRLADRGGRVRGRLHRDPDRTQQPASGLALGARSADRDCPGIAGHHGRAATATTP